MSIGVSYVHVRVFITVAFAGQINSTLLLAPKNERNVGRNGIESLMAIKIRWTTFNKIQCHPTFFSKDKAFSIVCTLMEMGGGYFLKFGLVCAARFWKPLPYSRPKYVNFPNLFQTWPKIWYPISHHTLTLFRLRKHLRRASNSQRQSNLSSLEQKN